MVHIKLPYGIIQYIRLFVKNVTWWIKPDLTIVDISQLYKIPKISHFCYMSSVRLAIPKSNKEYCISFEKKDIYIKKKENIKKENIKSVNIYMGHKKYSFTSEDGINWDYKIYENWFWY